MYLSEGLYVGRITLHMYLSEVCMSGSVHGSRTLESYSSMASDHHNSVEKKLNFLDCRPGFIISHVYIAKTDRQCDVLALLVMFLLLGFRQYDINQHFVAQWAASDS